MIAMPNETGNISAAAKPMPVLDNAAIAELLAAESPRTDPPLRNALRRASRRALLWPEEASQLLSAGRSLRELSGIGPHLERLILEWMEHPPAFDPPPETRSGFLTLVQARAALRKVPSWIQRVRGDLQTHTLWSDGSDSIEAMAQAAEERGYEYIAITDHSQGLKIAGGITEDELREQRSEIDAINDANQHAGRRVRILRSIELNLDPRGEGDMSAASLGELDIVLGCFHSSLRRQDDQTERYERALRNPQVQILGHPQGRIYNHRLGLKADWARVFAVAAQLDKAIEIDSYPDRQDLRPDLVQLAKESGCRISVATDAHDPSQLALMEFGLASALLAGIEPERIVNFMTYGQLLAWIESLR
jgi:histidinol phosphatase-like PHP family hydrolase